jgi:cell division protein FtsZ
MNQNPTYLSPVETSSDGTRSAAKASPFPQMPIPPGVPAPVLKVIGLGGGGCNAVSRMIELGLSGVDFIAANTDAQALSSNPAARKILLGPQTTRGFGAGGDPKVGRAAAEESRSQMADALAGADMVFLTAGMGGGTGTGAIPVAAEIARIQGAVTIAIVTTPFTFEMGRRQKNAGEGLARLREHTHTLVSIPNDRLLYVAPRNLSLEVAFRLADDVLRQAVQGITELITEPGLINVDFAHVRRLILLGGGALMAIGQGKGEEKARQALEQALHHPLLEAVALENAAGVIANFTGGNDLSLFEVQAALGSLHERTGEQTEIVMGVTQDQRLEGRAQVILMITGLGASTMEEVLSGYRKTEPAAPLKTPALPEIVPAELVPPTPVPAVASLPVAASPVAPARNMRDLPAFFRYRSREG